MYFYVFHVCSLYFMRYAQLSAHYLSVIHLSLNITESVLVPTYLGNIWRIKDFFKLL